MSGTDLDVAVRYEVKRAGSRAVLSGRSGLKQDSVPCSQYLAYSLGQNGQVSDMLTVEPEIHVPLTQTTTFPAKIYTLGQFNIVTEAHWPRQFAVIGQSLNPEPATMLGGCLGMRAISNQNSATHGNSMRG